MYKTMTSGGEGRGLIEQSGCTHEPDIHEPCGEISENFQAGQSDMAAKLYRFRRQRDALFEAGLFSDPAWDLLLDLYAAEQSKKQVCITSACIAAGVPTSTGLRWIGILVQNGLVERHDDHADARRSYLLLTDKARNAMDALFARFDIRTI
ncbi:helix-turn-helix domain-containing protein [Novosphingobium malaysiense]|uniref:hypothetical protein n=1 Tax=Novosphingobium malaysiense TaxID=1348853 RepID=UPI00068F7BBF|nr:hypothetical protein [Novosphingobium malaysiense]